MTRTDAAERLGTAPIGSLLLEFSLPAVINMTVVSLYNIISGIFIGQSEGPPAIAGLAITFPFMNLVLGVSMLTAVGGATFCSMALGAGRLDRAAWTLGHNVVLSLLFAVIFGVVGLCFLDPLLRLFGAGDVTLPYARDYMEVILWASPVGNTMVALNHFMRASGYPARAMLMSMLGVCVNLTLTPLFIFVFHWGIRGAAVATVIAQVVSLSAMLFHFCNKNSTVHFQPGIFRLRPPLVKSMLGIGLSPFLMNVCACLVILVINLSLRHHGGDLSIGAYGITNRLLLLFAMIIFGLTQGMQPIIGYNYGARYPDRVRQTLRYGIIAGTVITGGGFLAAQLFPYALARLFTTHPALIDAAVNGLRLCSLCFFLVGAQIVITAYFQSMGRAGISIFLSLSRQLMFLIPALLVLPRFIGLNGVWLSLPTADVLAFMVALFILHRTRRQQAIKP